MSSNTLQPHQIFLSKFRVKHLNEIYEKKYSRTEVKGVDRINGSSFSDKAQKEISIISRKAIRGNYKFSPYLELLKGKGRDSPPRLLAIPTLRDRIALHALKEVLFDIFPECVNKKFANQNIKDLKSFLATQEINECGFFRTDIKNFYGSINRNKLLDLVGQRVKSDKIKRTIERAITRPIVPKIYNKKNSSRYTTGGVPQGLSISNILAEIYLKDFDNEMSSSPHIMYYCRYVDDILIVTHKDNLIESASLLKDKIESGSTFSLSLNVDKTTSNMPDLGIGQHASSFSYLGYKFCMPDTNSLNTPKITPRTQSEEKFIRSIAALFAEFKRSPESKSKKKKLIFRVNEKLTGAISENKRYGWIFYFIEMNDLSSLYRIDKIVANMFLRTEGFSGHVPGSLKSIVRAYYHALHTPRKGYIHNYNYYNDSVKKRDFLISNEYISHDNGYSNQKINEIFDWIRHSNLSELLRDETFIS
jgi:RNA-directed DNA polymerase